MGEASMLAADDAMSQTFSNTAQLQTVTDFNFKLELQSVTDL